MRIGITSDRVVHNLCIDLIPRLREFDYDVVDRGLATSERANHAEWGTQLAREAAAARFDVGIAIYSSGIDVSTAVNKIKGVRAACVSEAHSATMSRRYDDADVLCFGL